MVTLKFSKNSWHYKFISLFKERYFISDNICGYIRDFILSCFFALLSFCFIVTALYIMVVAPLMWGFVMWQLDMFIQPSTAAGVGFIMDIVALLIAGFHYLVVVVIPKHAEKKQLEAYEAMQNGKYKPRKDSFVKAVYNKFHDKTCAKIEFE